MAKERVDKETLKNGRVEKVLISFGCRIGKWIREMLDMAVRDEAREGVVCENKMTHICLLLRWRFYFVSLFLVL